MAIIDHPNKNNLSNIDTIIFDSYSTLLTTPELRIRKYLEDYSLQKQKEIFQILEKTNTFEDVLNTIQFKNENKKNEFLSIIKNDLKTIKPYPETIDVLNKLKEKYTILIDSYLLPPYEEPIIKYFNQIVNKIILSFQEEFPKWEDQHYENLKNRLNKSWDKILFIWDNYKKDYILPKSHNFNALHLQRTGKTHQESIEDLNELVTLLNN